MRFVQFKRLWLAVVMFFASLALPAWAIEPFVIEDIQIEGLQRVEPGSILAVIPFRVGDVYDDEKSSAAIREIIALGGLQDVRLQAENGVLRISVRERPLIAEVSIDGFEEFPEAQITDINKSLGITEGKPFNRAVLDRTEQVLLDLYIQRGFYNASLDTTVTPIADNRVDIYLQMQEGEAAKIRSITIAGNKAFDESTLLSEMNLTESGFMTWYTRSDRYSLDKLNADLETIKSFYTQRGYLEFRIENADVDLSNDKTDVDIVIHISEGEQFKVTKVTLEGDYLGYKELFTSLSQVTPDSIYNSEAISNTVTAFTAQLGKFGYPFAKVEVLPRLNRATGIAEIVFRTNPSDRAYVRFINIKGNRKTRDAVIRRELRQLEGSWYNGDLVRLSRDRLTRLGYFKSIDIQLLEVAGQPDQADLDVIVEDSATGNIRLGLGYSSADKLGLVFGISQTNIFGSGQSLALDINTSSRSRNFRLSSTNPYFTLNGISRTIDLEHTTQRPSSASDSDYKLTSTGGNLRFGIPYSEEDRIYYGVGYKSYKFSELIALPLSFQEYITDFGASSYTIPLSVLWARDTRNNPLVPDKGALLRTSVKYSPAGTKYYRTEAQYQHYFPLTKTITFAFNLEAGYGRGTGGRPYPVFENFTGGGIGSVRGFENGTLGPIDASGAYPGGNKSVLFNTEITLPLPGLGNDRSARWFLFNDLGNVFGENQSFTFKTLRDSVGIGVSWISPIGPLKFSYAFPMRKENSDKISRFQFQIGTAF